MSSDKTIREFQSTLPWGSHNYNAAFQARTDPQRDTQHALLHITKAAGKLATLVDEFDHVADDVRESVGFLSQDEAAKYLADLAICAARVANTWPGGAIDLDAAIEARLDEKFPLRSDT